MKPHNKRSAVYLDESIKHSIIEDAADHDAISKRKNEPFVSLDNALKQLKTKRSDQNKKEA